jgi:CBS domain-containing protein
MQHRLSIAQRLDAETLKEELELLRTSTRKVGNVMKSPPIVARANEPFGVAAARMSHHRLKCLPVVDEMGKMVGVLSQVDVLRQVIEAKPGVKKPADPAGAGMTLQEVLFPDIPQVRPAF